MTRTSRRSFLRAGLAVPAFLAPAYAFRRALAGATPDAGPAPLVLDATQPLPEVSATAFRQGAARRPDGRTLLVDGRSLLLDGRPWLPVAGEFHYSRYPENEWREELLKMRAGGIDIAPSYVFWIHHEEVEGTFDWSGQRNLRRFVELCGEVGLTTIVRCGPWCHGEVRNGGLPDWILQKGFPARSNDPGYLGYVRRLYAEIARQLDGLLWKDGGPVIGIQCENEYGGPAEHLLTLKALAREVGLDVPLYTRTGWPDLTTEMPVGELLPLFGAYVEGFWDRELTPMGGVYREGFLFTLSRTLTTVGVEGAGAHEALRQTDAQRHPYFSCEIGGGMMSSYHRRILVPPADTESLALVKLGCGNNLQGYYMYHGGTNPDGRLTTLQESQATQYWNDLPVKAYDFQAPLGEYGQLRRHYHLLRRTHLFLRDHGAVLATLPARLPEIQPRSAADATIVRWSARTDGRSGLVFVNNHQRRQRMPVQSGVSFELRLPSGPLRFPAEPVTIPEDAVFFWPFHHTLGGAHLVYATAQPICSIEDEGHTYAVFAETTGIPAEFVFEPQGLTLEASQGQVVAGGPGLRIRDVKTGTDAALHLRATSGTRLSVILLDHETSLACWKGAWLGRERLFLTRAGLVLDGREARLTASDPDDLALSILPAPRSLSSGGAVLTAAPDGLFQRFVVPSRRPATPQVTLEALREAGPARAIRLGSQGVAEAPSDADFAQAAVWRLRLPAALDPLRDLLLRFRYFGDVARVTLDGRLLTDDFYDGSPFELGLRRHAPEILSGDLRLEILPLRRDAPIYFSAAPALDFAGRESLVRLEGVDVLERLQAGLTAV